MSGTDELPTDAEVTVDAALVARLVAEQFPQWAQLPIRPVSSHGTDHWMFRLGPELAVRLPHRGWAVRTLLLERRWLPVVARHLPVRTPEPVGAGEPAPGYPWPWTVARWVRGDPPSADALTRGIELAEDLAGFIRALRDVDPAGAPPTVWPAPLHEEDDRFAQLSARLGDLPDLPDPAALRLAWHAATSAEPCDSHTWIHGDLAPANLLLRDGRLHGVLDFSAMGLGDPASDLRPGWNLLDPKSRAVLRRATGADESMWARARGWVLLQALAQLDGYRDRNAYLAGNARRVLAQITEEVRGGQA